MQKLGRYLWLFTKIGIGVSLLVLSLREISWEGVISVFRYLNPGWLCVTIISIILGIGLKIIRWSVLLKNYEINVRSVTRAGALLLGQATNIILPVRGGEVVRLGVIGIDAPESIVQTGITIGLEKLLDLVAFLILAMVSIQYIPQVSARHVVNDLLPFAYISLGVLIIFILFGFNFWSQIVVRVENWHCPILKRVIRFIHKILLTSLWLRDLQKVWVIILLTFIIWLTMWSTNIFLLLSVQLPTNFLAGALVLVLGFFQVLPINMPGNIGTAYFFTEIALKPFGYPMDTIAGYAILLHALVTLPPLLFSALYLLFLGNDFSVVVNSYSRWRKKILSPLFPKS